MANRFLNNITINDQYTFPSTDGSAGQAIVTDGLGNLTFGSAIASSATSSESVHITVKNTSGATITKGTPVYVTGETGNSGKIEVAPADASDVAKMPALGLLESDLANNGEGFCVQGGLLEGLATATIDGTSTTANDTVYVKAGGGLTMTKPTGTNFIQNIAKVARVHASNGSLVVSSILRTNDVPTPLYIDHANQRVGIKETGPNYDLDVDGEVRITDRIGVNVAPADDSAIKFRFDNNDPNKNLAFGLRGDINLSGADNTTGDRNQGGIYLDIDSSADGDASDIHKLYGIYSDLKFSGYSRTAYGIRSEVEANNDTDLLTTLQGLSTEVIHDTASTGRSQNMHGVFSLVKIEDAGVVNKAYGAEFSVEVRPNRTSDLGEIWGSKSHIRIDATAAGLTYDDIIGAYSVISNNEGTTPSGTNTYLFKGEYTGQNGAVRFATNSWGLYVQGDKHYLEGNVGIGTTSPGAKLQVAGNGAFNSSLIVQDPDAPTNGNLALLHDSGGSTIYSNPASGNVSTVVLKLGINNSEKMRIANNGNVGIGTTSPGHLLEVAGNMRLQNQLYDSTNSQGTFNDVLTKVSAGTEWKSISDLPIDSRYVAVTGDTMTGNLTIGNGSADNYVRSYFSDGTYAEMRGYGMQFSRGASYLRPTSDKNLALNVGNDGQTWNQVRLNTNEFTIERDTSTFVKVDSSGNVGIGTTSPDAGVDIAKTTRITGDANIPSSGAGIEINYSTQGEIYAYDRTASAYKVLRLRGSSILLNQGNVGINTANPSQKLEVAGNIYAKDTNYCEIGVDQTDSAKIKMGVSSGGVNTFIDASNTGAGHAAGTPNIRLLFNASEKFRFTGGGNFGIGTTNPSHKLDVVGTSEFSERLLFNKTVNTGSLTPAFYISHTGFSLTTDPNYQKMVCYGYNANNNPIFQVAAKGFTSDVTAAWNNDAATRFTVLADGNVGIGTTSPGSPLHVAASGLDTSAGALGVHIGVHSSTYAGIEMVSAGSNSGWIDFLNVTGGGDYKERIRGGAGHFEFHANGSERLRISNTGNVGINDTSPSYKLDVDGTIRATGDVIAFSDIRVKENITTIENALDKVKKLRGVEYNKIDNPERSIGVIAQEIEEVIPEVVKEDNEGMKSVAYGNITAVLIEAIKEQQKQIDELKSIINASSK